MFNDYIQSGDSQKLGALPEIGFDQGRNDDLGTIYTDDIIDGRYAAALKDPFAEPAFSLGHVQFDLPSSLITLKCCSNILLLALAPPSPTSAPRLIKIDLSQPSSPEYIDLPNAPSSSEPPPSSPTLQNVFLDPTGRHAIVSTFTPHSNLVENFHVSLLPGLAAQKRIRPFSKKSRNLRITAVAWNLQQLSSKQTSSFSQSQQQQQSQTDDLLLGTSTGEIYELHLPSPSLSLQASEGFSFAPRNLNPATSHHPDRYLNRLFVLPDDQSITGLRWHIWKSTGGVQRAMVIATTSTRIYQFVGPNGGTGGEEGRFASLFQAYDDQAPKSLELPGEMPYSELHFFSNIREDQAGNPIVDPPRMVAWLTGPGIYHGTLSFTSQDPGDGVIESAQLLPYPASVPSTSSPPSNISNLPTSPRQGQRGMVIDAPEQPRSMVLTEFHFVLLYSDRIRIIGRLDDRVVHEEVLDLRRNERTISLSSDPVRKTCWLHTDQSIFELLIKNEDRDIWRVHLDKASFETALRYAKTSAQRDLIHTAQGDAFFNQERFHQAAQEYAQGSKSFEDVVLKFLDLGEKEALQIYLTKRLEALKRTDLTQRMMLATWLVEVLLGRINELEDDIATSQATSNDTDADAESLKYGKTMVEEDILDLMKTYKDNLDPRTVFNLISNHGRDDIMLKYAEIIGDFPRIVQHHVQEEDWGEALRQLSRQDNTELVYRYAPILIRHAAKEAVDVLLRYPNLEVSLLIPALLQPRPLSPEGASQVVRYLQYAIDQLHVTDSSVHNALLNFYAVAPVDQSKKDDEGPLLAFLSSSSDDPQTGRPYYDLDYALRLCKSHKKLKSCVLIYSKMGLHDSAVDLSLAQGDVELAKKNADLAEDDILRKKLWLKIAKHVVNSGNDIKAAVQFLESTNTLKIEDILPFFPDFVVIDDFKDDICSALEGYSAHIEDLRREMDEATASAAAIQRDIAELSNRFLLIDADEVCASCGEKLLVRQFYAFPCGHTFHADCLISEVTQHLPSHVLRRVLDLQARLALATSGQMSADARSSTNSSLRNLPGSSSAIGAARLAAASVQGLDQVRKLITPDALVGLIGGELISGAKAGLKSVTPLIGSGGRQSVVGGGSSGQGKDRGVNGGGVAEDLEKLRQELDDLLASRCVFCDLALNALDKPFVAEGEEI